MIASEAGYYARHRDDLAALRHNGLRRALTSTGRVDFSSNDYLALSGCRRIGDSVVAAIGNGVPLGSGGSRLLSGNAAEHEQLEAQAATFFGSEAALLFSSGYVANTTLLSTLPQRGDLIVHDAFVHASATEGMRLARADRISVAHCDVQAFDDAIRGWRAQGARGRAWLAVESLYSMDGDRAPLEDLMAVADRHDAILIVDEAHATGVFGASGRGLAAPFQGRENLITVHTCGKALGCEGALICGASVVRDFIINRGRGFIFSTAPSPLIALAISESLRILADEPERRERLFSNIELAEAVLSGVGAQATGSQIIPLILGDDFSVMQLSSALRERGYDIRGIRPPTVPVGTARLRISITLNALADDIRALGSALSVLTK